LELLDGNHKKVEELDRLFTHKIGGAETFAVTGQVYPRMFDTQIANALALVGQAGHKMANDIRILSKDKEMDEPSESGQVGSSAMAYKRNPMRCERATGLSRYLIGLPSVVAQTAAEQFLERTLDDSAIRRITNPEGFLTCDAVLLILTNVARGLHVYPNTIAKNLADELPFMATEAILMDAVQQGGDRQDLHERIRQHSLEAGKQVKELALPNDLVARLKTDPAFNNVNIDTMLNPQRHIGRAPEQVMDFIEQVVAPLRLKYADVLNLEADLKV
jgi:adenylosuccinate lyase